jgi:phosphatidylglycerol:prolipoprotein diacylglycerol transferase
VTTVAALMAAISYHPIVHVPIGPLRISPHGVGIAVGFVAGARLLLPEAERKGIKEDDVYTLLVRAAIGAMIGARVAYVVNHLSDYSSIIDILKVWQGGISLLGGIFGAILLALPKMRQLRIGFWPAMDAAAPGLALGIIIGRIGDLIVADHLGKTTNFFLGYRCPPLNIDTASPCGSSSFPNVPGAIVHQTALYDLILTIGLLALLLWLRRRPNRYDGFLIIVFGAWYGIGRVMEDFLREDLRHFGLTGSQITALVTLAMCWTWLLFIRRTPKWGRWNEAPPSANEPDPPSMTPSGPTTVPEREEP